MLPQLILIPGLLNDADLWRDQVAGLSDVARPVVADITRGETLAELAAQVLSLADDRFAMAGFSLGGIVAQDIMRITPGRVTHLALLDTTMLADRPDRAAERQRLIALARSPGKFHGFGEKLLETYLAPQNLSNATMAARVRGMTERLGPEVFVRQSLIDRPDSRATLRWLRCPVLVLCGEHDALTAPALHRDMAVEIPDSRLVIVRDAGHLTPIEQPEAVNAALRQLLSR
ncbi:alpha/beta fold hydrolase [uncultured Paracoccus sp.]|mgnify:CR=1 FL=1|uniref:alpha/beta fold hydrolase n=1 Tax=uncultured Paracoccus sp. TaxID=189685 RepID=UPI0032B11A8E|tara:strand:+ start:1306 stop:1998 length:693 start_codon:yes stop_codon:yes gene_type:complete